jgi:hypothetical protein
MGILVLRQLFIRSWHTTDFSQKQNKKRTNMTYIQIDSRGCGAGKTRNTIIPRIRNNIRIGIKTLVVVPSIELQKEYSKFFNDEEFTIVNSQSGQIYNQYQLAATPVVCMTHEGFLRTPNLEKTNCDLIIDEAFIPFYTETFNNFDSAGRIMVDFVSLVQWREKEVSTLDTRHLKYQPFFQLEFTRSTPANTVNHKLWQKLSNENILIWATPEVGNNLMQGARETTTLQLEVNPDILKGWSSVWIAAAVFEKTLMAMWMKCNKIDFEIKHSFQLHKGPSVWHIPRDDFSWSKNYRQNNPQIEQTFKQYCEKNRTGRLIYNSNNDSNVVFVFGDRITHNAHGINAYRDRTDYAFLSAIKPHPQFKNFIMDRCGPEPKELEFAFAGYMAYQLVMRTALRDSNNTTPVNLFFLDTTQALGIMDLFDPKSYDVKFIEEIEGNKKKKKALTNAERARLYRQRKKEC